MGRDPTIKQSLYEADGRRKYLSAGERLRLIETARCWPRNEIGTLALLLIFSGCRISEALNLERGSISVESGCVAIRSLKKRGKIIIREVPLPAWVIRSILDMSGSDPGRLWPLSRSRAWQLLKMLFAAAGIVSGPHATPKGARHGFGVHAIRSGVPIHLVQRWLGHADLATTAIYLQVMGNEEREIAARMWRDDEPD